MAVGFSITGGLDTIYSKKMEIVNVISPSSIEKSKWKSDFSSYFNCGHPEYFEPLDFKVGKKYIIGSRKYKKEEETETRFGEVYSTRTRSSNGALALGMFVEEYWKGTKKVVKRTCPYYKMNAAFEIEDNGNH